MAKGPSRPSAAGSRAARVRRTGIALVHEGELVLPAGGSAAQAEIVANDPRAEIHYHFPVEIEVRAAPDPVSVDELIDQVLDRLGIELEGN